ncbi:MAG: citrate synthase [Candidatus Eisenbacteria bacterium]|nr:citrate synthase [Candidatus Eisenbacteria bacterium]
MIAPRAAAMQTYDRGLAGLVAGDTAIGRLDGEHGRLWYRGYTVEDLAARASFEEVAFLILRGELPDGEELAEWKDRLVGWRAAPEQAIAMLEHLPQKAHPLAQFRTAMTAAACLIPEPGDMSHEAQWRRPARILAWTADLAAASIRRTLGQKPLPPRDELNYAANFLWQALGREPDPEEARAFEACLIVHAEHGLHAAALAALTVASTGADLGSAVLAGMGALSGELHGGAGQVAFETIEARSSPEEARRWARERLAEGYRFAGFGHRIYKTHDPRVRILEPYAERLTKRAGRHEQWEIFQTIREEVEDRLGPRGIRLNVDGITGLIYRPLGLPIESFTIPFCLAIQIGWMAQCLEYMPGGRLIEPLSVYVESPR